MLSWPNTKFLNNMYGNHEEEQEPITMGSWEEYIFIGVKVWTKKSRIEIKKGIFIFSLLDHLINIKINIKGSS